MTITNIVKESTNEETPVIEEPSVEQIVNKAELLAVANKEEKLTTSDYLKNKIDDKLYKDAEELQKTFLAFLEKTDNIKPSDSAIKSTVPLGIDILDAIMGGGAVTSLCQIVGMPGSGKTALAARALATGQRKWPGEFIGIFIDTEQSMTSERLDQLGVNYPPINPITEGMTIESVFKIIERLCAMKEQNKKLLDTPSCIVWDSIANTPTEKALTVDDPHKVTMLKASLLSFYLPRYVDKLNHYNISLIAVNQLRDTVDMSGGYGYVEPTLKFLDKNIPGGKSLLYNSVQLATVRQSTKLGGDYGFEGITVKCKFVKNKLFTPNIEIDLVFSFEHGFTNFWTNYELLKKFKRITAGGGWVTLDGYTGSSKCRQIQAIEKYNEDPKFKEAWDNCVNEVITEEFINKYKSGNQKQIEVW